MRRHGDHVSLRATDPTASVPLVVTDSRLPPGLFPVTYTNRLQGSTYSFGAGGSGCFLYASATSSDKVTP